MADITGQTEVLGSRVKVYAAAWADNDDIGTENIRAKCIELFDSKIYLEDMSLGYAGFAIEPDTGINRHYWYDNGTKVQSTFDAWDEYIPEWRNAPIVYWVNPTYNSASAVLPPSFPTKLTVKTVMSNFEYAYKLPDQYNIFYFIPENAEYFQVLYIPIDELHSSIGNWIFKMSDKSYVNDMGKRDNLLVSFFVFGSFVSGRETYVWNFIRTYANIPDVMSKTVIFSNLGYAATEQRNSVWWQTPPNKVNPYRLWNESEDFEIIDPSDDPYNEEAGSSTTGGGAGTDNLINDPIEVPALPSLSAVSSGMISIYVPSLVHLNGLASFLWSSAFDLDTFKKLFGDPMSAILGLSIMPIPVASSTSRSVKIGNVDSGISMPVAASQYVTVDCGSINFQELWGSYIDYDPFTKCEIYLPFVGTHPVSMDDVMGKTVNVSYNIDILSGACVAFIKCGGSVLYSFSGQCALSVPVTGDNWTSVLNGTISIAGAGLSMVTSGGASAPMALTSIASTAVNSLKPSIAKSGSLSGSASLLGIKKPYAIITRPRPAVPSYQNTFSGYPIYATYYLSELKGYTEIEKIHIENVPATGAELEEIENLLKSGVIF